MKRSQQFTTPVQYAEMGDGVTILVGHPDTKTWWRNFVDDHDIDVMIRRAWTPMTGRAISGVDEPETIARSWRRTSRSSHRLLASSMTRRPSPALRLRFWCGADLGDLGARITRDLLPWLTHSHQRTMDRAGIAVSWSHARRSFRRLTGSGVT